MIPYYGSKKKLSHFYPRPKYDKIIEPFAGSARYSLLYWDRDVTLVDKYDVIVKIWKWLQKASENDVLSLPRMKHGQKVTDYKLDCEEQRLILGFLAGYCTTTPRITATRFSTEARPNMINHQIKEIARNLHKIRHWKILCDDYENIDNQETTWFIDPPYQTGGQYYRHGSNKIDYSHLAEWCKSRKGQVIVCETSEADWLPFEQLKLNKGARNNVVMEAIWTNDGSKPIRQLELF